MNGFVVTPELNIFHSRNQIRIWNKYWHNANNGKYNVLNEDESNIIRDIHIERLRERFKHFYLYGTLSLPIRLTDGTEFLSRYSRIVVDDHGAYIEFDETDLLLPIRTKIGQEWRENDIYECTYHWKQPVTKDENGIDIGRNVKIHHQIKTGNHAKYLTNMMYVDACEVIDSIKYIK